MASGIFIGLEEQDLLDLRNKALAAMKQGRNLMSYSDSGSSASKQWSLPPKEMFDEAMFALSKLDPSTYGRRKTISRSDWRYRSI